MNNRALLTSVWRSRQLVVRLATLQLRDRYSNTGLGLLWAIVQPAMVMVVFWFVFVYGLRITSVPNEPTFVALLIVGLAPWFWFVDAVTGGVQAVTSCSYLVKKISFPLEILPITPVLAAFAVHAVVMILVVSAIAMSGEVLGPRLLLLPIYMAALAALATGLSFWLSALNVFHRDVAHTVGLLLQIWFWLTPIVWSYNAFPPEVSAILSWNPLAYVTGGYRYALLQGAEAPTAAQAACAWGVAAALIVSGFSLYRRLRSEFADVL